MQYIFVLEQLHDNYWELLGFPHMLEILDHKTLNTMILVHVEGPTKIWIANG